MDDMKTKKSRKKLYPELDKVTGKWLKGCFRWLTEEDCGFDREPRRRAIFCE